MDYLPTWGHWFPLRALCTLQNEPIICEKKKKKKKKERKKKKEKYVDSKSMKWHSENNYLH